MSGCVTSLKRNFLKLTKLDDLDATFHNVLVNAFAVMLIYSAHFGSCAIAPIVIESMKGTGGIDTHLLFSGMSVSSVTTALVFSFISPAIDKFGTRCCLILGGIFITTLPPSLFYPIPAIFLTFQAMNGLGCALMRAASLKFLTDNTPYDKLAQYNGLHWSIFMSCILVGNSVLFVATGSNDTIDNDLRSRICICLTAIGMLGVGLYVIAIRNTSVSKRSPSEDTYLLSNKDRSCSPTLFKEKDLEHETELENYQSALLEPMSSVKDQASISINEDWSRERKWSRDRKSPGVSSSVDEEYLESVSTQEEAGFWDSTKHLLRWSTINLVVAMWSCAVFPALFTTLGPMFIGLLVPDKRYVALFGICAGVGEIVGSLLAGKVASRIGIKRSAVLVALIAGTCVFMSALVFPLRTDTTPKVPPSPALFLFLGVLLGVGDASHGVILSTLIGRVYREYSQAGFAMYSLMFNVAAMTLYLVSSYCHFQAVIWLMVSIVCSTLVAILLLRNSEIVAEEKDR